MTTVEIEDYLTKQLFISKNIVTYRSLSREFGIHVNIAKNALATFHAKSTNSPEQTCSATYLISGEITVLPTRTDDEDMDVDYGFTPTPKPNYGFAGSGEGQSDGEVVAQIQMTVVTEGGFEDAKAKYAKVTSVHVYSLSPSPIRDADLLCAPTRRVRELDHQKGAELAKAVGRIVGDGIKMKEGGTKVKGRTTAVPPAQPAVPKLKAKPSTSGLSAPVIKTEDKGKELPKEEPKKPKQTGKLNFFVPKEQPSKNTGEAKTKAFFGGAKSAASSIKQTTSVPPRPVKEEKPQDTEPVKRGLKRKSTAPLASEEEEEEKETKPNAPIPPGPSSRQSSKSTSRRPSPQPTTAMSKLRLHKGAILSEEESDEQPRKKILKRPRRKASVNSDNEGRYDVEAAKEATNALKSMMEMDDDQVEKVSRKTKVDVLRQEEEEESEPEKEALPAQNRDRDMDISDDPETKPKPKPRKKKEKKTIPVGRNGLKKRRIMKSRTRIDEKGYMVTEDYSSYESVDEEEEVKKPAPKKKGSDGKRLLAGEECKEEPTDKAVDAPAPEDNDANVATSSGDIKPKPTTKATSSSTKNTTSRTGATAKGGRKQKTLNTFFGPPQPKK